VLAGVGFAVAMRGRLDTVPLMLEVELLLAPRGSAGSNPAASIWLHGYVGHIFARISGCSLWNVIRKQSSCSPEAKPWYHHLSPILVISFLIIFTYQRLWGKVICMFLHAAFWVWCLNIQGADQKRNHEATIHPFPIYTVIPFWCTTHVVDKHDVHISAYNIVVSWSNGTM
jgi:hypothetical protein